LSSNQAPRTALTASLPARIQSRLEGLYEIEVPPVDGFLVPIVSTSLPHASDVSNDREREVLRVRSIHGEVEVALHLPEECIQPRGELSIDRICQATEGVSHFVYLAERSRRELQITQLELEIQAEIDKYLLLAGALVEGPIELGRLVRVRDRLFDRVRYLHPRGSIRGDRYRLANAIAARFATSLMGPLARRGMTSRLRRRLKAFFEAGQREKLEIALAA